MSDSMAYTRMDGGLTVMYFVREQAGCSGVGWRRVVVSDIMEDGMHMEWMI